MTVPSPREAEGSRVSFAIEIDGAPIDTSYQVVSIDTWVSANKIPRATIVLFDGDASEGDFPISAKATFLPGAEVQIAAGYDDETTVIFTGIIVKHGIEIQGSTGSKLTIDIADPAVEMTLARKNAAFAEMTDGDLIGQLIGRSGLEKNVASTKTKHEKIVQWGATDWDLMVTRAEANGLLVFVESGKVNVKRTDASTTPVLKLEYGDSILDLQAEMDATAQYKSSAIKSYAWDPATQALLDAGPNGVKVTEAGNVTSDTLAAVFGVAAAARQSGAPLTKDALGDWSSAELTRAKLAKIRGHVRFPGSALAKAGETIELAGLGDRFNGNVLVSGVHHGIRDGRWITTATFGLSPRPFAAEAPRIAAPDAAGQLPPIKGLQTAVVKQVAKDPAGEFRVLVTLPLLQEQTGVWARLGTFYGGKSIGAVFYPEIGDEVIIAFMNEDPRYPVIVGSVYGKARPPPVEPDEKNNKKTIVTREKLTLSFDDKDKIIEIKTPGGHTITMDDKAGSITITDSNKNKVSLAKAGITMESASNIKIAAKGNIAVEAGGNLEMKATANATLEALQIANKAKVKFAAEGTGTAELKAAGVLTIQGALVKIN